MSAVPRMRRHRASTKCIMHYEEPVKKVVRTPDSGTEPWREGEDADRKDGSAGQNVSCVIWRRRSLQRIILYTTPVLTEVIAGQHIPD